MTERLAHMLAHMPSLQSPLESRKDETAGERECDWLLRRPSRTGCRTGALLVVFPGCLFLPGGSLVERSEAGSGREPEDGKRQGEKAKIGASSFRPSPGTEKNPATARLCLVSGRFRPKTPKNAENGRPGGREMSPRRSGPGSRPGQATSFAAAADAIFPLYGRKSFPDRRVYRTRR